MQKHTNKFPTVCISFILVPSLSTALTTATLQMACDRDRAELLIKCLSCCSAGKCVILLLWQFRPDFHVGHIIHKSVLSCCMCCHILSQATCLVSSGQIIPYLIWVWVLKSTVPQNSVQKSKVPGFYKS